MTIDKNTQRVRLTIEYDLEVFEDDPQDMYVLCDEELAQIKIWGLDNTLPDDVEMKIVPILEVGT